MEILDFIKGSGVDIALVIGSLGYFIKVFFNYRLRKQEITFSRLQENKILEIKEFYKCYQQIQSAITEYYHQTEFGNHSDEILIKIKDNINLKLVEFEYRVMTVRLFIDAKNLGTIDSIRSLFLKARFEITSWHYYNNSEGKHRDFDKLLELARKRLFEEIPSGMNEIEKELRNNFQLNTKSGLSLLDFFTKRSKKK